MNRWLQVRRKGEPRGLTDEELEEITELLNSYVADYRPYDKSPYGEDWEVDDDS